LPYATTNRALTCGLGIVGSLSSTVRKQCRLIKDTILVTHQPPSAGIANSSQQQHVRFRNFFALLHGKSEKVFIFRHQTTCSNAVCSTEAVALLGVRTVLLQGTSSAITTITRPNRQGDEAHAPLVARDHRQGSWDGVPPKLRLAVLPFCRFMGSQSAAQRSPGFQWTRTRISRVFLVLGQDDNEIKRGFVLYVGKCARIH